MIGAFYSVRVVSPEFQSFCPTYGYAHRKRFANSSWTIGIFTLLSGRCKLLLFVFQCRLIQKALNARLSTTNLRSINASTNLVVVFLPIPLVCKLHMQKKKGNQDCSGFMLNGF